MEKKVIYKLLWAPFMGAQTSNKSVNSSEFGLDDNLSYQI